MKQKTLEEALKFKSRQIGACGFVANEIMKNMISKPNQKTLGEDEFCNYSGLPSPLAYQQKPKKIVLTKQTRKQNDNKNEQTNKL